MRDEPRSTSGVIARLRERRARRKRAARVGRHEPTPAGADAVDSGYLTLEELEKRCIQNA